MTAKMTTRQTGVDWRGRRTQIADSIVSLYRKRPWRSVTVEEAADWLEVSYWQIYHSFDGREDMYRLAVERLIDRVADNVQVTPADYTTVNQAIADTVRHLATVIASDSYGDLLFLCLRDEGTDPWIRTAFQKRIVTPMLNQLEEAIQSAGTRHGIHLILLDDAPEECIAMLDCALCISRLWRSRDVPATEFESTVAAATKRVFRSTCTFDGFTQPDQSRNRIAAHG